MLFICFQICFKFQSLSQTFPVPQPRVVLVPSQTFFSSHISSSTFWWTNHPISQRAASPRESHHLEMTGRWLRWEPTIPPVAWLQRTQGLQTFATAILTVFNLLSGRGCFVFRIFWRWKWTQLLLVPWDMEMNMIATVLTNGHAKFHQPWPSHPSKQWMGYSQGPAMMVVGSKKDYLPTHRSDSMQQGAKPKDSFIS